MPKTITFHNWLFLLSKSRVLVLYCNFFFILILWFTFNLSAFQFLIFKLVRFRMSTDFAIYNSLLNHDKSKVFYYFLPLNPPLLYTVYTFQQSNITYTYVNFKKQYQLTLCLCYCESYNTCSIQYSSFSLSLLLFLSFSLSSIIQIYSI